MLDDSDAKHILVRISDNRFLDLTAEDRIQIAEDIAKDLGVWSDD